jgi:3-deoxy-manno-octulosonate cytidylyltransferase (CMP-KDO synthetase)
MSPAQVRFCALIPARLASQRLPDKPLAEIGGVPMVVRVARRATASGAERVVVCTDSERIVRACEEHGVEAILTRADHPTGTDRLAQASALLGLDDAAIVVNVQGDEPLIPPAIVQALARVLDRETDCEIATAAHPLHAAEEFFDPNVVKVVLDHRGRALLFSRAPIPWSRAEFSKMPRGSLVPESGKLPARLPALRHIGIYAYRVSYLRRFPNLSRPPLEEHENLEQLRALYHGAAITVMQWDAALPPGVDTPSDLERIRAVIGTASG